MVFLYKTSNMIQNGEIEDHHFINISIKDSSKQGDGMAAYIVYKVETNTNIPTFRKNSFCVHRRFSDFLGLHDKLVEKYLRTGRIIPPAPQKSVIGMTKIKMSGQVEQPSSNEFVERRRASLERYLQRTAAHPTLCMDSEFKEFLTNENELPRATNTSTLSGAGMIRWFNKVGETVNKITYKMDENDLWFEEKTQEIECLENGLRKLHSSVECLVLARKDLASYTGALAKTMAMLSSCEEHGLLASSLARLHELQEKVENLHNEQSNSDFSVLCELLKDYISLIGAIKCVFHERVKVYQHWNHSLQMLNKKREYKAKMELSNRSDKGNVAANEITEWEAKVERCEEEFNSISKMIKKEMESFSDTRIKEFKSVFIKYMEQQMRHQMQLIEYWEAFLPDAKAIA
ncbi:sorting nexin-2 isoform X2 [Cimex lectularius]|uniref:PX domain-containing protein n=1 Tax=Cimex lectularius TaxID=79782 RepID=A0A8I6SL67_CIMLE|nr:sorting nexin-2 isoform X2 [Cimex lectularius]